ncbi:exported hypothetical protein [Mesorhizobium plurifarium]|uniref:Peptidoglycan binding-like domain-containing protein n=1 Tax=Mesorhizobium plurifarium TaxID=69974 RepID=A0A090E2Q8_MESPL|nr:exported hypothetical protein [Mesorhizobium plurifarium]
MTCLHRLLATLVLLLAISATIVSAGAQEARQTTMELGPTVALPFVPSHVMFRPGTNQFFVAGDYNVATQQTRILGYSGEDRLQQFEFIVPHSIDAMAFSVTGDRLFVVGGQNGQGYVSAVMLTSAAVLEGRPVSAKLAHLPTQASIAVDTQSVYVGDATSEKIFRIPSVVFDREHQSSDFDSTNVISSIYAPGAVHALGVSDTLRLAFVSSERVPKIWAVQLDGPERVIDEYARPTVTGSGYGGDPIPMAFLITSRSVESKGQPGVSFLIAEHVASSVSLVDYDPLFQTMDVITTAVAGNHLDPGTTVQVYPDTKLVKQPVLLGSDDNQSTILVGDLYSRQLVQFSRGPASTALERVGVLDLPSAPTSLAVSGDGSVAAAAIADSPDLQILTSSAVTSASPTEHDARVRELQRKLTELGLDVGAVDGVRGSTTDRALQVFQQATGTNLPPGDVDAAIRAVTQFRDTCSTSGLACLRRAR